jgi:hypothetical protein
MKMRAIRVSISRTDAETMEYLGHDTDIIDVPSNMQPEDVEQYLQEMFTEEEEGVYFNFSF